MTLEEEGIYVRLMSYCWREGSIPADPKALSRLCKGASPEALAIVMDRFIPHPADPLRLTHKRLQVEREKQESWRSKQSTNGRKGGEARKPVADEQTPSECLANAKPVLSECQATAKQMPSSSFAFASSSSSSSSKQEQPRSGDASLNSRMLCEKVGCFVMREQSAVTQVMGRYSRHGRRKALRNRTGRTHGRPVGQVRIHVRAADLGIRLSLQVLHVRQVGQPRCLALEAWRVTAAGGQEECGLGANASADEGDGRCKKRMGTVPRGRRNS